MKNKIAIITGVILFVILVSSFFIINNNSKSKNNKGIYCSSEGTLSDTQNIQSHRSYCIKSNSAEKNYAKNVATEYSFSIINDQGSRVKDFKITHTKIMHVIVVRKDVAYFQHIHPEFNSQTGIFTLKDLTFPENGEYRIFADFVVGSEQKDSNEIPLVITISEDVFVNEKKYVPLELGSEEKTKIFKNYEVTLSEDEEFISGKEVIMSFTLKRKGELVTNLEEYLGALGHSVIFKEKTLNFIHTHPKENKATSQNGKLEFNVIFPESGKYKIFTQFKHEGKVFTTDFVVTIKKDVKESIQSVPLTHKIKIGH